jgi:hypothetical protein
MKRCPCGAALADKGTVEHKSPGLQERIMRCEKGHTLVRTIFRPMGSKTKPSKGPTMKFLTVLEPSAQSGPPIAKQAR